MLFTKIDKQETTNQVTNFLKDDFNRLLVVSNRDLTGLHSMPLNLDYCRSIKRNSKEDAITNKLDAQKVVNVIVQALNHCDPSSKTVLIELNVKNKPLYQVQNILDCGRNKLKKLVKSASLEFADIFIYWQAVNNVDPLIDLHVYKD